MAVCQLVDCWSLVFMQVEQSVRFVCLCVRAITLELNKLEEWHAGYPSVEMADRCVATAETDSIE